MATKIYTAIPAPLPQGITVTDLGRGRLSVATVKRDEAMVDYLRGLGSKWNRDIRAWEVPGTKRDRIIEKLTTMAAKEASTKEVSALYAEAFSGLHCATAFQSYVRVNFEYDARAVAAVKTVPSAKWDADSKVWTIRPSDEAALAAAVEACRKIDAIIVAARAEKQAQREAEQAARAGERAKFEARRILVGGSERRVGETFRCGDRVLVVTDLGKVWRLRSEDACMYGRMPEDQDVRYAYVREAKSNEIEVLEAVEAAEAKTREERKVMIEAFRGVEQEVSEVGTYEQTLPEADLEAIGKGDLVWHQRADLALYGGGTEWVATDDRLWRIDGNGADGDDWSRNNFRRGIARWIPRQDAHVEALRAMAGVYL